MIHFFIKIKWNKPSLFIWQDSICCISFRGYAVKFNLLPVNSDQHNLCIRCIFIKNLNDTLQSGSSIILSMTSWHGGEDLIWLFVRSITHVWWTYEQIKNRLWLQHCINCCIDSGSLLIVDNICWISLTASTGHSSRDLQEMKIDWNTATNTKILPSCLVWKFCGKA